MSGNLNEIPNEESKGSNKEDDIYKDLGAPTSIDSPRVGNFLGKIDIKYPIEYRRVQLRGTAEIYTDTKNKRHIIRVSPGVASNPDSYVPDIAHEICHAKFSEQLEPIFSTVRFSPKYDSASIDEGSDFIEKAREMELSQAFVDIWIDDMMSEIEKDITKEYCETTSKSIDRSIDLMLVDHLRTNHYILAVAMNLAEAKRHKIKIKNIKAMQFYGNNEWQRIRKLRDFMAQLPKITDGKGNFLDGIKETALLEFEKGAQFVARQFKCNIEPRLIERESIVSGEQKYFVWDF